MSSGSQNASLSDCWTSNDQDCYNLRSSLEGCGLGVDLVGFDKGSTDSHMILYYGEDCRNEYFITELVGTGVYWFNLTEPVARGWYMRSWQYA